MEYYKFVNDKIQDQALQEAGITVGRIYPGDTEIAFEKVSYWVKAENTKKDWIEVPEEEYWKQKEPIAAPNDLFLEDQEKTEFKRENFPAYKCHKEVGALKITKITNLPAPLGQYCPARLEFEGDYKPIEVDVDYMVKNKPKVGGYFVVYEDGYVSYSPAEAFEAGYTKMEA